MKRSSTPPSSIRSFSTPVEERDVAAAVDREEVVGHARPEERALGVRRNPVALQARLAVRVDDRDLRARASAPGRGTS